MQKNHAEQLAALTSGLFHDWLLTLSEEQLKDELKRFDRASGGLISASYSLLAMKMELKKFNELEKKSA